jgi:hypothetical protein
MQAEQHATGGLPAPVDGNREPSEDDQQTAMLSPSYDSPTAALRANFPLPRELRDQ